MQPHIDLNWWAIMVSLLISFVIGSLWYGPVLGKAWAHASGLGDEKPSGSEIARGSVINLIGTFFTAFVLAHEVAVWRPSSWNMGMDAEPFIYGFYAGFFVWIGFIVPLLLNGVAFEKKSWKLFGINAAFQFISLQAMGMILAYWR